MQYKFLSKICINILSGIGLSVSEDFDAVYLRSGIIVSMSSTSSNDDNYPTQGCNNTSSNVPATSSEQVFTRQIVVTQTTNQNVNTMIFGTYTGPMPMYMLPLGYTPLVVTTVVGPTCT